MRTLRLLVLLAAPTCVLGSARSALAVEPEVTSETAAQFYDVRSPTGQTVISRRRLTTTLGVGAYDLLPPKDRTSYEAPELTFRARLRYDADYGSSSAEQDETNTERFVPGFSRGPVDLMYAYVEGRKFLSGWLGFKIGRQYMNDSLGWWSFDGGTVRVTTPFFVTVEGYGGLEVRGGLPLSTPRFERPGVWRGDRTGFDPSLYPAFQSNDVAPAMGAAIETSGFTWLHGRLDYRRVYNTGRSNTSEFANGLIAPTLYDGTRISQERLGYSVDGSLDKIGGIKGGLAYDFYMAKMSSIFASVDGYLSRRLTLSLDYDFYSPTYDGDSIWNFFAGEPMNDVALRANLDVSDNVSISGRANVRIFKTQSDDFNDNSSPNTNAIDPNYYPPSALTFNEGAMLALRHRAGENTHGVRANGNFGKEGNRIGGDLFANRVYYGRYLLEGRASIWHWDDRIRAGRDATDYQLAAGIGYRMSPRSKILFEYQVDVNRLVGVRNRAMVWLTVAVAK
jgi:hypothetical protein